MKKYFILSVIVIGLLIIAGCGGQDTAAPDQTPDDTPDFDHDSHDHEHGELPYEWSGEYSFEMGTYTLTFEESGDPSCDIAFLLNEGHMDDIAHLAHHIMEEYMEQVQPGESFTVVPDYGYTLVLNPDQTSFTFEITEAGDYVVFLEHFPHEFDLKVLDSGGNEAEAKNPVEYEDCGHYH